MANCGEGCVEFTVSKPAEPTRTPSGAVRLTWYMELVSKYLEEQTTAVSKNAVKSAIPRNERHLAAAIATLIEEGFVTVEEGPRRAELLTSVRPYRQAEDSAATPAGGEDQNPF